MKKILLVFVCSLFAFETVLAQEKNAVGLRSCDWYLNAGVGGALGLYDFDDSGFLLGLAGSCAFGCHFKNAPISLEVDYRPVIGAVIGGGHDGFFDPGFWNFGLSVKFHF